MSPGQPTLPTSGRERDPLAVLLPDDLRSRPPVVGNPFVGRDREIAAIREALRFLVAGQGVLASIEGPIGSGKSALVSHLATQLESMLLDLSGSGSSGALPQPWIASAVCRRGPASAGKPHQAMAAIFDAIAERLALLPRSELEVLAPGRPADLLAIAPVLATVPAFDLPCSEHPSSDTDPPADAAELPSERRHRGHRAARDLFHRLSARRPITILLDDAAWADPASIELLTELTRPPDAPPILWLLTATPEETADGRLDPIILPHIEASSALHLLHLDLDPLPFDQSCTVARCLLAELGEQEGLVETIAEASQGSPGWIAHLANDALDLGHRSAPDPDAPGPDAPTIPLDQLTLGRSVARRIERLPPSARGLLRVLAVSDRPLPWAEAVAAMAESDGAEPGGAGTVHRDPEELTAALEALLDEDLVRRHGSELDTLDLVDAATREAVLASIGPTCRAASHRRLADSLGPDADDEERARHLVRGERQQQALDPARRAAELALKQRDGERAIELCRLAVELSKDDRDDHWRDLRNLGRALDLVGAYHLSAAPYRRAADLAPATEQDALRHSAGDRWLTSGRPALGLEVLEPLAEKAGLVPLLDPAFPGGGPGTRIRRTLDLASWRLRSLLFGLPAPSSNGAAAPADTPAAGEWSEDQGLDLCFTLCRGLRLEHPRRWQELSREHLLRALRRGDPMGISRALALETTYLAYDGRKRRATIERQAERAVGLARQVHSAEALAFAQSMVGQAWALLGEWRRALATLDRAQALLESDCPEAWWERRSVLFVQLRSLAMMGRLTEIGHTLRRVGGGDPHQGPFFTQALEQRFGWLDDLANHRVREARRRVEKIDLPEASNSRIMEALDGASITRYWQLYGAVEVEIYDGHGARAWDLLDRHWSGIVAPRLADAEMLRIEAWHLRARAALAGLFDLGTDRDRESTFRPTAAHSITQADDSLDRLLAIRTPWSDAAALATRAALEGAIGHREEALDLLRRAHLLFEHLDMALYAEACRYQHALASGERPDKVRARMEELGATDPDSMARLLVPGPWG